MSSSPTKLQRWLDLVAFLAARRFPVSTEDVWANVPAYAAGLEGSKRDKDSARRTFERDKDELRSLGIPIETVTYAINYGKEQATGYRLLKKDFHLPYLKLLSEAEGRDPAGASSAGVFEIEEEEVGAALDGLRELAEVPSFPLRRAARSAFRKLTFDLEPGVVSELPLFYAEDAEAAATRKVLQALSEGVRRCKTVHFRYLGMARDTSEGRRVNPYGLLFQHGRWYMVAHDLERKDLRMFRVGRMDDVRVNTKAPETPDYRVPTDFQLTDYAGRKAWELGEDPEGVSDMMVHFRFPRSLWAERNGHGELVEEDREGGQKRRFQVRRREPFVRWVLSLAGDAWIEAPDDLQRRFRDLAARVGVLHAEGETHE